ncbi:MAG: hypothetical protein J6X18_02140 [Bacteroidales bacterium]|nr:hypothetical protein [Bacteroidales bacterium]
MFEETEQTQSENVPRLIYVDKVGTTSDGVNTYHFMYSDSIDDVWVEQWSEKPACNCRYLCPDNEQVSYVKEVKTDVDFKLAISDCCHSYQDCVDDCVSICYEDIDRYIEYPEPFRIVLHYGDTMEEVDAVLAKRDIVSRFVQ